MYNSTDNIIAISLDRQAEKVRQVQAVNQPQLDGTSHGPDGRTALALATTGVVIASLLLAFAIH